ncbi:MAG: hypothetical protein ABSA32_15055 [Candidatus Acidiferrales bacterium]|jgi:hypothetical protein
MRVCAIFLSLLLPCTGFAAPQTSQPKFILEDGTPIKLVLAQTISSADEHVGNLISLAVAEDVTVDNIVVIPKGALAWGTVRKVESKRRMGRAGKLELTIDKVRLADGERAPLTDTQDSSGGSTQKWMVPAMVATGAFAWPAAPIFLLMRGKDVTIPQGTHVLAFMKGDSVLDPANFTPEALAPPTFAAFAPKPAAAPPAAPAVPPAAPASVPSTAPAGPIVPAPTAASSAAAATSSNDANKQPQPQPQR